MACVAYTFTSFQDKSRVHKLRNRCHAHVSRNLQSQPAACVQSIPISTWVCLHISAWLLVVHWWRSKDAVLQDCMQMAKQTVQHMELLGQQAAAWQCVAHAESVAAEQESHASITQATSSLSLQQKAAEQLLQQQQYMLDNLDKWVSFVGASGKDAHFTLVPPALQQIAVRPFMLDNALNYLAAPSIDHRVTKQEQPKSAFAKLFTWKKK